MEDQQPQADSQLQPEPSTANQAYRPQIIVAVGLVLLLGLFIATVVTHNKIDNLPASQVSETKAQPAEPKLPEGFGEIGLAASNDQLEVLISQLDCAQSSYQNLDSQRGKLCLLSLQVDNRSDNQQSLNLDDLFLYTVDSLGYRGLRVQYKATRQLNPSLAESLEQIGSKSIKAQLVFDLPSEVIPTKLILTGEQPLTIHLDNYSVDRSFDCQQDKTVSLNGRTNDCSYEYHFSSLDCSQPLIAEDEREPNDQLERKLCIARFNFKNISNDTSLSPYSPNVTYRNVYYGFYNHAVYLLDQDGNKYAQVGYWGLTYNYKDLVLPERPYYYDQREDLAPGQSSDQTEPLLFVVPAGAELDTLSFEKQTYYYGYWGLSNSDTLRSSSSLEAGSTSADSTSSSPSSQEPCPTCFGRD